MKKFKTLLLLLLLVIGSCTVSMIMVKNSNDTKIDTKINADHKINIDSLKVRK